MSRDQAIAEMQEGKEDKELSKRQEQERRRIESQIQQKAREDLKDYKKRLRETNDLKRLQVEELELNLRYYAAIEQMIILHPKIDELDAKHNAMIEEEIQKERRMMQQERDERSKIVTVKQGTARE